MAQPRAVTLPDFLSNFHDQPQLRELFILGQKIAEQRRRKSTLRRKRQLINIDVLCRSFNAALYIVFFFERSFLCRDKPEHDHLALWHKPEGLKATRAFVVVF